MTQSFSGFCEPERLEKLQNIFDRLWMELRAKGTDSLNGPEDPDVLRDEIARRVLEHSNNPQLTPPQIAEAVLLSLGVALSERA
jgi:hypothetical protein